MKTGGLSIRVMRMRDLPMLVRIMEMAFTSKRLTAGEQLANLKRVYATAARSACFIAHAEGEPVGFVLTQKNDANWHAPTPSAHVRLLAVAKDFQGRGVGTRLLRMSLLALKKAGYSEASVNARLDNAKAIALYERVGFERDALKFITNL